MGKRTNTATWNEKYNRWQINVQKDGYRRSFYSSAPAAEKNGCGGVVFPARTRVMKFT